MPPQQQPRYYSRWLELENTTIEKWPFAMEPSILVTLLLSAPFLKVRGFRGAEESWGRRRRLPNLPPLSPGTPSPPRGPSLSLSQPRNPEPRPDLRPGVNPAGLPGRNLENKHCSIWELVPSTNSIGCSQAGGRLSPNDIWYHICHPPQVPSIVNYSCDNIVDTVHNYPRRAHIKMSNNIIILYVDTLRVCVCWRVWQCRRLKKS